MPAIQTHTDTYSIHTLHARPVMRILLSTDAQAYEEICYALEDLHRKCIMSEDQVASMELLMKWNQPRPAKLPPTPV